MLATSRMLPSTRWMHAVWWRRLRAEALAGDRRLGRPMPFQTTFPHERLHRAHTSSSRPIRRWPYLIRSGRVVEVAAAEAAEAVVVAEAEVVVVVQVGVARAAAVAEAVARVEGAQEEGAREGVVRVAPVQVAGREAAVKAARAEAQEEAREAAPAVAVTIPSLTITIRPTTSRGLSCRHSHPRLRPTSRSWLRWRKERADSQFSTPTTCWVDSNASDESRTSSTSWATCPATRRKEAATR